MANSVVAKETVMMIRPRRNWTAEEDAILKREVKRAQSESDNISWHEIAAFLPGRTNKDCRKRWYGTTSAKVRKGPWTEAEDERLRKAIDRHGTKWAAVASAVGTRLPDQCSKRWSHAINPEIDHSPWTAQEDELLIRKVNTHGHYWQQIVARYFPGRTSLAAKNRYHILQRRLKNDSGGDVCRMHNAEAIDMDSWQQLLRWPENSRQLRLDAWGSSDQSSCYLSTVSNEPTPGVSHGCDAFVSEPGHTESQWPMIPVYDLAGDTDAEAMGFPFLRDALVQDPESLLDCALRPPLNRDNLMLQRTPPTASMGPASLLQMEPSQQLKFSSAQRKVVIQAVCPSDNLGAMFEAVTKFSLSAVIKTDE